MSIFPTCRSRCGQTPPACWDKSQWSAALERAIAATAKAAQGDLLLAASRIASKQFLDLRDTALTRLYLSGSSVLQSAAISGHEADTVHKTLKHYIALNESDGKAAIAGANAYMKANGILV